MFLPLQDGVAMRRLRAPFMTWALIAFNIVIFLITGTHVLLDGDRVSLGFGAIPALITGKQELGEGIASVSPWITLFTSQFLHADWFHLGGNMLFLFIFGDNVEDAMGHIRFLIFFLVCGVGGGALFVLLDPSGVSPLIGASGAISGVMGAYLMLYPQVRIFGLVSIIPMRIKAIYVLGLWSVLQIYSAIFTADSNVAFVAHIGGALVGAVLIGLFKSRDVPLFSRISN